MRRDCMIKVGITPTGLLAVSGQESWNACGASAKIRHPGGVTN